MKEKSYSTRALHSTRSDPSGSRGGIKLSAKLRARMKKLEKWRILPSSIKSPKNARQFHGGHATVSKAFLLRQRRLRDDDDVYWMYGSYWSREALQLCRQSPESDDHIQGAVGHRRGAEGELGDREKDDNEEHGSDSDERWWGEFVAVKKSRMGDNKDARRALGLALREMEFLVELSHPNIVEFKGFIEDLSKDMIWLVFPWADNGNLKDFVASHDWEIPERISLINDVASGLEHLHSQEPPVCHGDLKSYNVLVNSGRRAMITDFGSARRLTEDDLNRQPGLVQNQQQPLQAIFSTLSKTITLTGNIYTLRWAAPELLFDDQMSLWSDIWALGWIAYEVLTNSILFGDVPADAVVVERVINGELPSIDGHVRVSLFENLCSLMTMCWSSNPSERPTAKDYVHAVSDMPMVVPNPTSSEILVTFPARVLMTRGREARMSGDLGMAFGCFTEAHRIYTRLGNRRYRAEALWRLADVHRARNEYGEAIELYSEVLQIRTDRSDKPGRTDALWALAEVHQLRNDYRKAIVFYFEVLQFRTSVADEKGIADALCRLASIQQLRNEYSTAIAFYSEALQIRTDLGDSQGRADALCGLASVHGLRNKYSEAVALYSKVLQIRTDLGDSQGRADALCGLASMHRLQKEYNEANALDSEVLQLRTDVGDSQGRADALWGLATMHRLRNEYSEAIALYSEVLQIWTDIGDRQGRADALKGIADIRCHQNRHHDAISLYEQAAKIFEQSGNGHAAAYALKKAADTRQRLKLVETA